MPAITSDGWAAYPAAIGSAFGYGIDYSQLSNNPPAKLGFRSRSRSKRLKPSVHQQPLAYQHLKRIPGLSNFRGPPAKPGDFGCQFKASRWTPSQHRTSAS
jgi:hypothetical protein